MNEEVFKSMIKFREVSVKYKPDDSADYSKFFVYPAAQYYNIILHDKIANAKTTNWTYLYEIDKNNITTFFNEHLKYGEELRLLWDRREQFDANIFEQRYKKTKSLLIILCKFILTFITNLYFSNLWMFEEDGITSVDKSGNQRQAKQISLDLLFKEGKAMDFHFDLAIQESMKMEKKIKKRIYKMLDRVFPPINDKTIINNVFNNSEQRKEIKEKIKKNMKTKKLKTNKKIHAHDVKEEHKVDN